MSNANTSPNAHPAEKAELDQERDELLQHLDDLLEGPMVILAFVWLALLIGELVWGRKPVFEVTGTIIWILFIIHFIIEFILAPHKIAYVKKNWLIAISLLVPALRVFRIFRVFQLLRLAGASRSASLFQVVSSLNRGMYALRAHLQRRGFGYIGALTLLVLFVGAAGMYAFENQIPGGLHSYGDALWWTAMIMTTMGSAYWPQTFEGRALCLFLAIYAFTIFGYVTATLATFFIGRDADNEEGEVAGMKELRALQKELSALREDIRTLSDRLPK